MPRLRPDLSQIRPYRPGRSIEEVAQEHDLTEVVKLASNESPYPPFPEVQRAIAAAATEVHRYPDTRCRRLRAALAAHTGVAEEEVWLGGGSNELMTVTALAAGGPGTSAVYGWPSFGLYRIATQAAWAEGIEVPLDTEHRLDLVAMRAAIREDTTVVYICNPNNPTGTHLPADRVAGFVDSVSEEVLVVVDEAYMEFARAGDYGTALPLATTRPNVVVARTFSKVYGLAGLRIGYMVGDPALLAELRRVQLPFSVSVIAQAAAAEALRHPDQVAARVAANAAELKRFLEELAGRGIAHADSQTNFVYLRPGSDSEAFASAIARRGVIVRPFAEGWVRVTVGSEGENQAFFTALDLIRAGR